MLSTLETQVLKLLATASDITEGEEDRDEFKFKDDEHREKTASDFVEQAFDIVQRNLLKNRTIGLLTAVNNRAIPEEMFVYCAETALKVKRLDIARVSLDEYFSLRPIQQTQFYIRSLFCESLLQHAQGVDHPDKEIAATVKCLDPILRAIDLCLEDKAKSSYLVHEASVHYWNIAHKLFRYGAREQLIASLTKITQSLADINDDVCWRVLFIINLALSHDDANNIDTAISTINSASELLQKNGSYTLEEPDFKTYLEDEIFRTQIHISRRNLKKITQPPSNNNIRQKCIMFMQLIKSGITTERADIVKNLTDCFNTLKATSVQVKPKDKKPPTKNSARGAKDTQQAATIAKFPEESLCLFGELGVMCMFMCPPLLDIAKECAKYCAASSALETRIYSEYLKGYIMVVEVQDHERERLTQKMISIRTKSMNVLEKAIDSSKRLMTHLNSHKNALLGGDLVNLGCIILWNVCIPLLQTNIRPKVISSLQKISETLETTDSNLHELRVSVHLETARCHIVNDTLAKAIVQIDKAITLDYKPEFLSAEEKQSFNMNRPMDRYLVPLKHNLDLQTSLYKLPESHEDEAFLLIQQAKSANNVELTKTLLERAITLLELLMTDNAKLSNLDNKRVLMELWSEVLKIAWKDGRKIVPIARKACSFIINPQKVVSWDKTRDRERIIEEGLASFILAESFIITLDNESLALDLPLTIKNGNDPDELPLHPDELTSIVDSQLTILRYIEKGIDLGIQSHQDWLILNGCIYLWNYHLQFFQDWKMFYPFINILSFSFDALMGVHNRSIESESGYPPGVLHPHHLVLLRISYAYIHALIQQYFITDSQPYNPDTPDVEAYKNIYQLPFADIFHNPYTRAKPQAQTATKAKPDKASKELTPIQKVLAVCEKVIPIFAKQSDTNTTQSLATTTEESRDSAKSFIMLAKDIIALRCRVLKLESSPKTVINPLSTDPTEQVIMQLELLSIPTLNAQERTKFIADAFTHLNKCSVQVPELCSKLSEYALQQGEKEKVVEIAKLCESVLPEGASELTRSSENKSFTLTERQWRWHALNALFCGQGIALFIPGQDQQTRIKYQLQSLMKLVMAMKFASLAKDREIGVMIGDSFLKVAFPIMSVATTSVAKIFYCQTLIEPLDLLLFYASQVVINLTVVNNQEEKLKQKNIAAANIFEKLYTYLFACLRENREYERGLSVAKQGLNHLPLTHHKHLWKIDIEFKSRLGLSVQQSISRVGGYDKQTQAMVYIVLGHYFHQKDQKKDAFKQAVDVLQGQPTEQVDYMVEYALWLYMNNYPIQESTDLLQEAVDILNIIDESMIDYNNNEEVKSVISKRSKMASMKAATVRSRKQSLSLRSKRSRFSGAASQAKDNFQDDQGPLTASQIIQMVTIYAMLSLISQDSKESMDFCLSAQFYVLRLIVSASQIPHLTATLFDFANSDSLEFSLPSSLQEWIGYDIPDKIRAFWKTDSFSLTRKEVLVPQSEDYDVLQSYAYLFFQYATPSACTTLIKNRTINVHSVSHPQHMLYILNFIAEILLKEGYIIHCIPVLSFMIVLAEDIIQDKDTAALINLKLSHAHSMLNDLPNAAKYRQRAGVMAIDKTVQLLLHGEHELLSHREMSNKIARTDDVPFKIHGIEMFVPLRKIWIQQVYLLIEGRAATHSMGEFMIAKPLLEESLSDASISGDWTVCALCYYLQGKLCHYQGQSDKAISLLQKAVNLHDQRLVQFEDISLSLEFYRRVMSTMITVFVERKEDHRFMFNAINKSLETVQSFLNIADLNAKNSVLIEIAALQNAYGETLLNNADRLKQLNTPAAEFTLNLFQGAMTNLESASSFGLLYVSTLHNYVQAILFHSENLGNEQIEELTRIDTVAAKAKKMCERILMETVPSGLDAEIRSKLPLSEMYGRVMILKAHVELLLQEAKRYIHHQEDSYQEKERKTMAIIPKASDGRSEEDAQHVLRYLIEADNNNNAAIELGNLMMNVETALAQVTSATNVTDSPYIQVESQCYVGKCLHCNVATRVEYAHIHRVELDEQEIQETSEEMIKSLETCIGNCKQLFKSGKGTLHVLRILSLAAKELSKYYLSILNEESAGCYSQIAQNTQTIIEKLVTAIPLDSAEMCLMRLQQRAIQNKQWDRVKLLHDKLVAIPNGVYRSAIDSINQLLQPGEEIVVEAKEASSAPADPTKKNMKAGRK